MQVLHLFFAMFAFILFENYIQVTFFCPLSLLLLFAQEGVERGTERAQCPCSSSPHMCFRTTPHSHSFPKQLCVCVRAELRSTAWAVLPG